jgi:anti-sigma factor RsiW
MKVEATCHERAPALSAYVDGELGQGERERLEAHVAECARCRQEVARFERLTGLLREVDAEELTSLRPVSLWPAVEREALGLRRDGLGRGLASRWKHWAPAWARPLWVPVSVAAALAITLALPFVMQREALQADEAIVESVDEGEVMVIRHGRGEVMIWVFDD